MAEAQAIPADPVAGLIDIPLPQPVSLWPQTWELRLLIAIVVASVAVGTWWALRSWWINRYRREALAELDRIARSPRTQPNDVAGALALLVRRTALAVFPREQVVALSGGAWLGFLDRTYGGDGFTRGAGRALGSAPYEEGGVSPDIAPLVDLVRRWIRTHHA